MAKLLASTINLECVQVSVSGNGNQTPETPKYNSGGGAIQVNAPVGIGGANQPPDVRTIQDALNRVSPADGGASPPLVVDGVCGPKTKNAIQQFQLKQFGWSGADGKINPGGQTITRLNEILGGNRPASGGSESPKVDDETSDEIFKQLMTAGLMQARQKILAAQTNLDMALVHVDEPDTPSAIPSLGRAERMRLANRYFKIDKMNPSQRRQVLSRIRYVYATMLQVFERPGGLWGEKAFQIDSSGITYKESKTTAAHTDYSGYFKGGKPNQFQKELRGDSIFFVRENMGFFLNMRNGVGTIIHELAHFCGDERAGWRIEDFGAYGEPENPRVARLNLAQLVRHADTYARFAMAAGS
ncbi:MAG TPA: peptidoglycan-binding protein [Pyrinomonadaceae bacterium]|nr:peptidoglycan-binding protein [Pyrinomonadaceae bacterium]